MRLLRWARGVYERQDAGLLPLAVVVEDLLREHRPLLADLCGTCRGHPWPCALLRRLAGALCPR